MNKMLKVAITLSAYDKMSRAVSEATTKSEKAIKHLKTVAKDNLVKGAGFLGGGATIGASVKPVIDAYSNLEDASLKLKSVMLRDGNKINEEMFKKVNNEAVRLGNKLPGTTADFQTLFSTMLETGVGAQNILNGSGAAAAYLAVQMDMATDEAGKLAGKVKNAMGIPDKDMMKMMDFIARMKNVNVEAGEMQFAFAKSSMALKALGVQGFQDSKLIGNLFAQMISTGQTGETVGTNFGRIMQSILNPKKFDKFQEGMKAAGLSIELFDKKGKFKGIGNFITEFSKLNGMDVQTISRLLEPLTGGEGVDSGFLTSLAMSGAKSFNDMNKRLFEQATLTDKVNLRLGSFRNMWEATKGTFENFLASIGQSFAPEMKSVVDWLGKASAAAQEFSEKHPGIFKLATGTLLLIMTLMSLNGTIALVRGAWALMAASGLISLGSLKFALFAIRFHVLTGLIPAISAAILQFRLWAAVNWILMPSFTSIIAASWAFTASLLANPITWIVLAVVALGAAFIIAYQKSEKFRAVMAGLMSIGKLLLDVFIGLGKVAIGTFTMDFSMIKEGAKQAALASLQIMRPGGLTSAFKQGYDESLAKEKSTASPTSIAQPTTPKPIPVGSSGGGNTIHFSPIVNLQGSATKDDGENLNKSMKTEFDKLMKDYKQKEKRTAF